VEATPLAPAELLQRVGQGLDMPGRAVDMPGRAVDMLAREVDKPVVVLIADTLARVAPVPSVEREQTGQLWLAQAHKQVEAAGLADQHYQQRMQ